MELRLLGIVGLLLGAFSHLLTGGRHLLGSLAGLIGRGRYLITGHSQLGCLGLELKDRLLNFFSNDRIWPYLQLRL
jgi:uncharacterized membrane protein SpoIIM required for sporulation